MDEMSEHCIHCGQEIHWQGRYDGWESCAQGYWFSSATGSGCPKSTYGHERAQKDAAFAHGERLLQMEADCKAVCQNCATGEEIVGTQHRVTGVRTDCAYVDCEAAPIREAMKKLEAER